MKTYEEWVKVFNIDGDGRKIYRNLPERLMKTAWEAGRMEALEWVLENAGYDDHCNATTIERSELERELEEE